MFLVYGSDTVGSWEGWGVGSQLPWRPWQRSFQTIIPEFISWAARRWNLGILPPCLPWCPEGPPVGRKHNSLWHHEPFQSVVLVMVLCCAGLGLSAMDRRSQFFCCSTEARGRSPLPLCCPFWPADGCLLPGSSCSREKLLVLPLLIRALISPRGPHPHLLIKN